MKNLPDNNNTEEVEFLHHEPCSNCGSSDAAGRYSNGRLYCYSCQTTLEKGSNEQQHIPKAESKFESIKVTGEIHALSKRRIREETAKHWNYRTGTLGDQPAQFAYYYNKDEPHVPIAVKVRFADKSFKFLGDTKNVGLYGEHLVKGNTRRKIIICEGELDALSVSQVQSLKWPVVSVPTGASGAVKAIKKRLDWLSEFEEVVLAFDNDKPGQDAAKEIAQLFAPGKAKIVYYPEGYKDASDFLQQGESEKLIDALWSARPYRPDGIIDGETLWDIVNTEENNYTRTYPWHTLNEITYGLRAGELVTITAGSGVGKTKFVNEIAYHLIQEGETVGMLMLEQNVKRTALELISIDMNQPLHLDMSGLDKALFRQSFDNTVGSGRCFLYDHFGSTDVDNLLSRVRYMAVSLGCKYIILDHLSIVVSGMDNGDERRLIDMTMTQLRTLVEETGCGLMLVSHLKRPEGNKGHEEGAITSLSQLRGSHAIAQLSDMVIGLERNQQADKDNEEQAGDPNKVTVRVLKNRFSGDTGVGADLFYNRETGRLTDMPNSFDESIDPNKEYSF